MHAQRLWRFCVVCWYLGDDVRRMLSLSVPLRLQPALHSCHRPKALTPNPKLKKPYRKALDHMGGCPYLGFFRFPKLQGAVLRVELCRAPQGP